MSKETDFVLSPEKWNPEAHRYMNVKVNDKGGKSINIISTQSGRMTHISTPLMMTWGISPFVDEKGDSKFSIALNFPNEEYRNAGTDTFLDKLKRFENKILDDAVANSVQWWGRAMSKEVCSYTFFPFVKYQKNKDTKESDYSKPPSIRAKVPYYDNKWTVEIYDTKDNLIFPCGDDGLTPLEFVPERSSVACVLQCGGIWIGGKGWGVTWKLIQCVVKPREVVKIQGRCRITLSDEDRKQIEDASVEEVVAPPPPTPAAPAAKPAAKPAVKPTPPPPAPVEHDTLAEDSDAEPEAEPDVEPEPEAEPEPVAETDLEFEPEPEPEEELNQEPTPISSSGPKPDMRALEVEPEVAPKVAKKVLKAAPAEAPPAAKKVVAKPAAAPASADAEPAKKKVVKKKADA